MKRNEKLKMHKLNAQYRWLRDMRIVDSVHLHTKFGVFPITNTGAIDGILGYLVGATSECDNEEANNCL